MRALEYFPDASGRVVWPVADHPLVLGTDTRGKLNAAPVIDLETAQGLGVRTSPVTVAEYSDELRARMRARPEIPRHGWCRRFCGQSR
jgi:hypothetical protein